ncbi:hypothetical protein TSAR_008274, partial [Trichomalopsis sarcophagae]
MTPVSRGAVNMQ